VPAVVEPVTSISNHVTGPASVGKYAPPIAKSLIDDWPVPRLFTFKNPCISRVAAGVVVPMPMKPVFKTVKIFVVVAMVKSAFEAGMVVVPIIIAFVVLVRRSIPVPVAVVKLNNEIVEEPTAVMPPSESRRNFVDEAIWKSMKLPEKAGVLRPIYVPLP